MTSWVSVETRQGQKLLKPLGPNLGFGRFLYPTIDPRNQTLGRMEGLRGNIFNKFPGADPDIFEKSKLPELGFQCQEQRFLFIYT